MGNTRPRSTATLGRLKVRRAAGTLAWLIGRYRETSGWAALSAATRRQRENIFEQTIETAGTQPIGRITTATMVAGRERRLKTPHQARHFLDAMRGLFRWAHEVRLVKSDPTAGVKNPSQKKGPGFLESIIHTRVDAVHENHGRRARRGYHAPQAGVKNLVQLANFSLRG